MNTNGYPLIPILFYPLKVLFVDDNNAVLESYKKAFANKFPMSITNSSINVLPILQKNKYPQLFLSNIGDSKKVEIEQEYLPKLLESVNLLANDPSKYNNYQILIVDYDMPELNGIDLCNKCNNIPVIKILLTGKYQGKRILNCSKTI